MNNKQIELRFNPSKIESDNDGNLNVSGYVNKTDQPSNILGTTRKFIEKISKGAFKNALSKKERDIDFLAEHDSTKLLSSTRNQSLELTEDENGLFMKATIAPTSWGKDTYTLIKSGLYSNMSFGFKVLKDNWKKTGSGLYERTISELELFEVSVVKNPAYSSSTIAARGIDVIDEIDVPEEIRMEENNMDEQTLEQKLSAFEDAISAIGEGVNSILAIVGESRSAEDKDEKDKKEADEERDEDSAKEEETEDDKKSKDDSEDKDQKSKDDKKSSDETKDKPKDDEDKKKKEETRSQIPSIVELRSTLESLKQEA